MRLYLDHTLLLYFLLRVHTISSYVALQRHAPKTYRAYDSDATPTLDAGQAKITPGLRLRQLMNPDSQIARYFASRPTAYLSVPYAPATVNGTSEECLLWDPNCKGNRTEALLHFFGDTMRKLLADSCFTTGPDWNSHCTETPKPDASLVNYWSTMRSWMREPACQSARHEAHDLVETIPTYDISGGCCGSCGIGGPNVDVYYWESPNANTECLNIIGTEVSPPLEGATTIGSMTYWGVITAPGKEYRSVMTTMLYTSVNGIYFKMPLVNPWDPETVANAIAKGASQAAIPMTSPPSSPKASSSPMSGRRARANPIPLRPRQATNPMNITQKGTNDSHISTAIYNGHTFTSPSIYVDFYSLRATDQCGYRGTQNVVTSTLLAFAPGELLTYGGPLTSILGQNKVAPTPYNFDDLPCPPQSVMEDQWYKPEPGQPYRPIIAFPPKLTGIDPAWEGCTARLFTGYDPPRALASETVMAANPTPLAVNGSQRPAPDPKTTEAQMVPDPKPEETQAVHQPEDQPKEQAGKNVAPSEARPTQSVIKAAQDPIDDPSNASDQEMAKIQEALKPTSMQEAAPAPVPASAPAKLSEKMETTPQQNADSQAKPIVNQQQPAPPKPIASVGGRPIVAVPQAQDNDNLVGNNTHSSDTPPFSNVPIKEVSPSVQPQDNGASAAGSSGAHQQQNQGKTESMGKAPESQKDEQSPKQGTLPQQQSTEQAPKQGNAAPQIYRVGSQKMTAGGAPLVVDGTTVSAPKTGGVVVGDQTYQAAPTPGPVQIEGHAVEKVPSGYNIDGLNAAPGGPPVTAGGQVLNIDKDNNLHVSDQVYSIKKAEAAPPTTIAGHAVTPIADGKVVVEGITLTQGGPEQTISGTPVSLGPNGNVNVNGHSYPLPEEPHLLSPTNINGQDIIPLSSGVSIAGTTLLPGGSPATVSGKPVSLDQSGNLHFGGSSYALPPTSTQGTGMVPTTIAGEGLTPLSNGAISVAGTTLIPGAPAITGKNGERISLDASSLILGSSTVPISVLSSSVSGDGEATITTINGEEVAPVSNGVSIEGTTLTPGAVFTGNDGQVVSLGSSELIVGSSTVSVQTGAAGGGFTIGGSISPSPNNQIGPSPTDFAGKASGRSRADGLMLYITIAYTFSYIMTTC